MSNDYVCFKANWIMCLVHFQGPFQLIFLFIIQIWQKVNFAIFKFFESGCSKFLHVQNCVAIIWWNCHKNKWNIHSFDGKSLVKWACFWCTCQIPLVGKMLVVVGTGAGWGQWFAGVDTFIWKCGQGWQERYVVRYSDNVFCGVK